MLARSLYWELSPIGIQIRAGRTASVKIDRVAKVKHAFQSEHNASQSNDLNEVLSHWQVCYTTDQLGDTTAARLTSQKEHNRSDIKLGKHWTSMFMQHPLRLSQQRMHL